MAVALVKHVHVRHVLPREIRWHWVDGRLAQISVSWPTISGSLLVFIRRPQTPGIIPEAVQDLGTRLVDVNSDAETKPDVKDHPKIAKLEAALSFII